jgi:hypothetical protein
MVLPKVTLKSAFHSCRFAGEVSLLRRMFDRDQNTGLLGLAGDFGELLPVAVAAALPHTP